MTPDLVINRELSWLAFNERVLEEAERESLPLLERVKFLAISASNLDEFFMVRVGGLQILKDRGQRAKDAAGFTPSQQLDLIRERATAFIIRQYSLLNEKLLPALQQQHIRRVRAGELTPGQRTFLDGHFQEQIFPVLSPLAVMPDEPPLLLPALQIVLLTEVKAPDDTESRHVMFTLPSNLPRQVVIPEIETGSGHAYINLEDLVELFLHHFFTREQVMATARFRISRNSDIAVDDESALDLASEMEELLEARNTSATIRLEIEAGASRELTRIIQRLSGAGATQTFVVPGELDLRAYFSIAAIPGHDALNVV
ncbi:MAG: polyphosphate kinase 1, partial [Verrucomicrobiaceae bacterium]